MNHKVFNSVVNRFKEVHILFWLISFSLIFFTNACIKKMEAENFDNNFNKINRIILTNDEISQNYKKGWQYAFENISFILNENKLIISDKRGKFNNITSRNLFYFYMFIQKDHWLVDISKEELSSIIYNKLAQGSADSDLFNAGLYDGSLYFLYKNEYYRQKLFPKYYNYDLLNKTILKNFNMDIFKEWIVILAINEPESILGINLKKKYGDIKHLKTLRIDEYYQFLKSLNVAGISIND